jgi:hypothetical protein
LPRKAASPLGKKLKASPPAGFVTAAAHAVAVNMSVRSVQRWAAEVGEWLGLAVRVPSSRGRPLWFVHPYARIDSRPPSVPTPPRSLDGWSNLPAYAKLDARRRYVIAREWDRRRQATPAIRPHGPRLADVMTTYVAELAGAGVRVTEPLVRAWHSERTRNNYPASLYQLVQGKRLKVRKGGRRAT